MSSQFSFPGILPEKPPATFKQVRDYQDKAIESIFQYFHDHRGSPLVVAPTGAGKSLLIAEFARRANTRYSGTRILILSHVAILLEQNAEEMLNQYPEANISFYSDSLNSKDLSGQFVFGGIQSIYKKAYKFPTPPDLIIVDEAHTIPHGDMGMYRTFLNDMKIVNPDIKIIGFTATPYRSDHGMLHKGKNALFTHVCYDIPVIELISRGYLAPIVTPQGGTQTKMNAAGMKTSRGDYITSGLSNAFDNPETTKACVDEIIEHGKDRKKWIVFTIDINHCVHVMQEIKDRGISCDMVHSKMKDAQCSAVIQRYKNNEIQCLVNVSKLTTGFNVPAIDLMAFMRPTRSPVLYVQTAGRGMRTHPGKENCLLLDFGGVVETLGPIDQIRIKDKKESEEAGAAPTKNCPNCGESCPAGCLVCPSCYAEFPPREVNLSDEPSDAAVLSSQLGSKRMPVTSVKYYRHKKEGKPDSLRVDYLCGIDVYREWTCLEHSGIPREKACQWWRVRKNTVPPVTVTEALERTKELAVPTSIEVRKIGKYHEITGYNFGEKE